MRFLPLAALLVALVCNIAGCSSQPRFRRPLPPVVGAHEPGFQQGINAMLGGGIVPGNRIETFNNGDEIFAAMLAAIRGAQRTINFETFVYYHGDIPDQFADALIERAQAGVEVRVLLDAVGAAKSRRYHARLREAGVQLALFHPVWWIDVRRYNHRTHRKLLIVDGRVGFIGGVGIGDDWKGNASSPEQWRDVHYRVRGPVVAQLQGGFAENWIEAEGEVLQGPAHYPALKPAGSVSASVFLSAPRSQRFEVELMYHLAIAGARRSIRIINPYFIPDRQMTEAFVAAARRGVRVQIIMPGEHIDQKAVRRASRKRWPELLAAGVELYEYRPDNDPHQAAHRG